MYSLTGEALNLSARTNELCLSTRHDLSLFAEFPLNYQKIYIEYIAKLRARQECWFRDTPVDFHDLNYGSSRRAREFLKTTIGYTECHHILPTELGGTNQSSNLVYLTAEEHVRAHLLLAKIHGGRMWAALNFLVSSGNLVRRIPTKRMVRTAAFAREKHGESLLGDGNPFFGKKHSDETLLALRDDRMFTFSHKRKGTVSGTQHELCKLTGLGQKAIHSLTNGEKKSYKGWVNSAVNPDFKSKSDLLRESWRSKQEKVTLYHSDGDVWEGYPVDFMHNYAEFSQNRGVRGWYHKKADAKQHFSRLKAKADFASKARGDISGAKNPMFGKDRRRDWKLTLRHKNGETYRGSSKKFADEHGFSQSQYQNMIKTFRGKKVAGGSVVRSYKGWESQEAPVAESVD